MLLSKTANVLRGATAANGLRDAPKVASCGIYRETAARKCSRARQTHMARNKIRHRAHVTPSAVAEAPGTLDTQEILSSESFDGPGIHVEVTRQDGIFAIEVTAVRPRPMMLHWGMNDWEQAPESVWPSGTVAVDDKAVQSPFENNNRVRIEFPEESCPARVVFVLKETEPEAWINNGGDFYAYLKAPSVEDVVSKVLDIEGSDCNWSLASRLMLANEVLDAADAAGPTGMAFVTVWLRLSAMKQLAWYRQSARQGKDIAAAQEALAQRMTDKARSASDPGCRRLARMALSVLPRGGGDGDAIRMGILNIMREHGIREGHRPGIEDPFIEQWHQKLHQNTNPEDITICEAYLAFLESGDMEDFWKVALEHGNVTKESLAAMDQPITHDPVHLPQLIESMKHYLHILKVTHGGADLDNALEFAKDHLDGDLQWHCYDLLKHRTEWWAAGKVVEIRRRLDPIWRETGSRDVLLLDIALDSWFRTLVERTDKSELTPDAYTDLIQLTLDNGAISGESIELYQVAAQWRKVCQAERWSHDWGLQALAAADRASLTLGATMDSLYGLVQPHAEAFRDACDIDQAYITNFGEEMVRGQPLFMLSVLLRGVAPHLREAAEVSNWQVVSQAPAKGQVTLLPSLADVQGHDYREPRVLICENLGGNEDIPGGVVAVLTSSPTDVLSHVAIRARSQGVLLATCFDELQLESIKALEGKTVELAVSPTYEVTAIETSASSSNGSGNDRQPGKLMLRIPKSTRAWALSEDQFSEVHVGGKSMSIARLRATLSDTVAVPSSVALPFGSFERTLSHRNNTATARRVAALQKQLDAHKSGGVPEVLEQLRHTISTELLAPEDLASELSQKAREVGIRGAEDWESCSGSWGPTWSAICQVWASKWSARSWLSRQARGVRDSSLYMAALVQQVIPAQYAFVAHTADPLTGDRGVTMGEVVVGMGESLVGNQPGRALSFTSASGNGSDGPGVKVNGLPSKRLGLFAEDSTIIVRSDSNGEDLESFAGAGLYESITVPALHESPVDYAEERLFWDSDFQMDLVRSLADVSKRVEAAFDGQPQDIEGVWVEGKVTIVQTRPQVLD